jgi:hypothetical protein
VCCSKGTIDELDELSVNMHGQKKGTNSFGMVLKNNILKNKLIFFVLFA